MLPSRFHSRLSFANVVSVAALFVALGGSAYAAIQVTGKNVKDSSLTGRDIRNSSLTTSDVKNRSLLALDFKSGQLPRGDTGPAGHDGSRGPGAVDLHFSGAAEAGVVQHRIASVGPWTVSYACRLDPGHLYLEWFIDGPGDYQFAGVEGDDQPPGGAHYGGGGAPGQVFSGQAGATKFVRYAYTVELHSPTGAATVSINALADYRDTSAPACFGNGTGVATG